MKFGVREICDVVLRAKSTQKVGDKVFYKNEPVIYFDTLKTSTMEGAATTVYAQGGRGNSRLVAWEGERTITFTMEDALISPVGFMILSGAGLIDATEGKPIFVHVAEQTDAVKVVTGEDNATTAVYIIADQAVSSDDKAGIYVMAMTDGEIETEPFIGTVADSFAGTDNADKDFETAAAAGKLICVKTTAEYTATNIDKFVDGGVVMLDYYTEKTGGAMQIEITPDKFGGNYYLEASTLFRDTNGVDMPAEFIIPNCKIQSNFTFTMASSGDPSAFTFTMDAFPDYTRFDKTKKVLCAIQIITEATSEVPQTRTATDHDPEHEGKLN